MPLEMEYLRELPSDRLARSWCRTFLYCIAFACLARGLVAIMDREAALAASCAFMGLVLVVIARLIWPR